ncbi:MAG: hypothetical protein GX443_11170 [Deltaproteobacteria bacterium]|nr:hypothetical protein [Deltaproteobacteria bacterium]
MGLLPEGSLSKVAEEIRELIASHPENAKERVEACLAAKLAGASPDEKIAYLDKILAGFSSSKPQGTRPADHEEHPLAHLLTLLLGERISSLDLASPSPEISGKLATSLNTILDNLNELVSVIRSTLLGEDPGLQTIRHFISADLRGDRESASLETHLKQIKGAFLTANQAFRRAARTQMTKVLEELDPEKLSGESEKGLKFGFMRKAELLDVYKEKYDRIRKWFESERSTQDLSREFERVCQQLLSEKGGDFS